MSNQKTTIISLSNETTASQSYYEVSQPVLDALFGMSEHRIARYMPRQSPHGQGYEAVMYAEGLVRLAQDMGVPDRDIIVRITSVSSFFFDTGWQSDSSPEAQASNSADEQDETGDDAHVGGKMAGDLPERVAEQVVNGEESVVVFDPSVTLTQEQIETLRQQSSFVDGQFDYTGDEERLVYIVSDGSRFIAIAPAIGVPDGNDGKRIWEQPYEVKKVPKQTVINSWHWVPIDDGDPDAADDTTLGTEIDQCVEILWEAERATEV